MKLRIAQIKMVPVKCDLDENHRMLVCLLGRLEEYHPDVVVTPEGWLDGYCATEPNVSRWRISVTTLLIRTTHLM